MVLYVVTTYRPERHVCALMTLRKQRKKSNRTSLQKSESIINKFLSWFDFIRSNRNTLHCKAFRNVSTMLLAICSPLMLITNVF